MRHLVIQVTDSTVIVSQLLELLWLWEEKHQSYPDFSLFHTKALIIAVVPSDIIDSCCSADTLNTVRWDRMRAREQPWLHFFAVSATIPPCQHQYLLLDCSFVRLPITPPTHFTDAQPADSIKESVAELCKCQLPGSPSQLSHYFPLNKSEKSLCKINMATSRQQAARVSEQTCFHSRRIGSSAMQTLSKWFASHEKKQFALLLCFTSDKVARKGDE